MTVQLTIGGDDFSGYVVSTNRNHSICNPIASVTIVLSPNIPRDITTYENVIFYEDGTRVFTGYTQDVVKSRLPVESKLTCMDTLIRAKDSWITAQLISDGESVRHWVQTFLWLAGITSYDLVAGDYQVFPGAGWQYITAWEGITQILKMCPYQIYADRNGTVRLVQLAKESPTATINSYISYERVRSDSWIRNRVVVLGYNDIVADLFRSNAIIPGEVRTVAVATGQIYSAATAHSIANAMLDEFANPLDTKTVVVPGNPSYEMGQVITFTDPRSGYTDTCVITGITSVYDASTYQTEVRLDEKCPHFWGWDIPPTVPIYLWCSTWGDGVYRSTNEGVDWGRQNGGDSVLDGTSVWDMQASKFYLSEDNELWTATSGIGVYKTDNAGDDWSNVVIPAAPGAAGHSVRALLASRNDSDEWYALSYDIINSDVYLHKTIDDGENWTNIQINGWGDQWTCDITREYIHPASNWNIGHKMAPINTSASLLDAVGQGGLSTITRLAGVWTDRAGWSGGQTIRAVGDGTDPVCPDPTACQSAASYRDCIAGWVHDFAPNPYNDFSSDSLIVWAARSDLQQIELTDMANHLLGPVVDITPHGIPTHLWEDVPNTIYIGTSAGNILRYDHAAVMLFLEDNAATVYGGFGKLFLGAPFMWFYCAACNTQRLRWRNALGAWAWDLALCPSNITCVGRGGSYTVVGTDNGIYWRDAIAPNLGGTYQFVGGPRNIKRIKIINATANAITGWAYTTHGLYYFSATTSINFTAPTYGYHYSLEMNSAGDKVFVALLDSNSHPVFFEVDTGLLSVDLIYYAGAGSWGGVLVDTCLWAFGDMGVEKIATSIDDGETWTDVTDATWLGNELVRPVLSGGFGGDNIAILNVAGEVETSPDLGANWNNVSASVPFTVQCGERDISDIDLLYVGRAGANALHLQASPNGGIAWDERSTGIMANLPITTIISTG